MQGKATAELEGLLELALKFPVSFGGQRLRESASGKGRTFESSRARKQFACRGRAGCGLSFCRAGIKRRPHISQPGHQSNAQRPHTEAFPSAGLSRYDVLS
jgi:hypothetical protein